MLSPSALFENQLLTTPPLPSSNVFVALMASNLGKSLIGAAGQSHLKENHPHAWLRAHLLQVQIDLWKTTLAKENANVKSLETLRSLTVNLLVKEIS
jgi:hypothetical protein